MKRHRIWGSSRRERQRHEREKQYQRLAALAARLAPPVAPITWRAGWGCRALGAIWLGQLVAFGPLAYDRDLGRFGAVDWFIRVLATVFSGWILGRLWAWQITADATGVWIPRLWKVQCVPWDLVGTVRARADGTVVLDERPLGPFLPPLVARALGRRATATTVAGHLTIMAHANALRPGVAASRLRRGLPYAPWALVPLIALAVAHLIRAWR
ncbi:hypothetical protein [Streptomyces sp. NPDC048623]|uniref:hypothetical protein n=1 Tax=Streptomyces sp. NPDC048623 TaxID=3155761 RepID=UPI00341435A3